MSSSNQSLVDQVKSMNADKSSMTEEIQNLTGTKQNLMNQLYAYKEELQHLHEQHRQAVERIQQGQ